MSEPVIVLHELCKAFGDTVAVDHISMTICKGDIFGFLGANGAGKTTTMRMLCGLLKPSSGWATLAGDHTWKKRMSIRSRFGYVAQRFSLYPDLTVTENLRFFGGACRVPHRHLDKRIAALLHQTDIERKKNALAGSLSGGMKQLLSLACALIHDPEILFLDEPTAGLDPVHRQQLWNLLYELSESGKTIFVTTHYMDEAERCTEIGFLHSGRLLVKDHPRALKRSFTTRLLDLNVEPAMTALAMLRETPGVLGVALRSGHIRVYAAEPERLIEKWQQEWPFPGTQLLGYEWVEPDMEDVFSAYSQGYTEILTPGAPEQPNADAVHGEHPHS
ncbi:ABC transporter ATP-binding protein [Verrucomicrobiota bacterium sgz303538]